MKKYLFLCVLFLSPLSFAQKFECNFDNYSFDNTSVNVAKDCSISIIPKSGMKNEKRKRSYTFTIDGLFMIFVNTNDNNTITSNTFSLRPKIKFENRLEYSFDESLHILT